MTFQRGSLTSLSLEVFADTDYASKATDRRSVCDGVIVCGGACVCWFSRAQKCVALSTTEAEHFALGDAVKELTVFETGVAFHVAWEGYAAFSGVRRQPRRFATCAEPSDELEFQAHRCTSYIFGHPGDISVTHVPPSINTRPF